MNEVKPEIEYSEPGGQYCYRYPRPSVTSDSVIFGFDGNELKILLVERGVEPFKGMWALPGGFMKMDESIEQCAAREVREETNVNNVYLEQFEVFSCPDRDPRGRVVTVAFIALVRPSDYEVIGGDDAARAAWFEATFLPPLAFDHKEIISKARIRLREILRVRPVAFRLLDEIFTVDELRKVYEAVNGTSYDRRNFQRKLMASDIVEPAVEYNNQAETCISENQADMCITKMNSFCNDFELHCESSPLPAPTASSSEKRSALGRKPSKLLRLKDRLLSKIMPSEPESETDNDDSDSRSDDSIKDLFNF